MVFLLMPNNEKLTFKTNFWLFFFLLFLSLASFPFPHQKGMFCLCLFPVREPLLTHFKIQFLNLMKSQNIFYVYVLTCTKVTSLQTYGFISNRMVLSPIELGCFFLSKNSHCNARTYELLS